MVKQPEKQETVQVAFRLERSLVDRLDAHAERMGGQMPGMKVTRADALRVLLTRALDEVAAEADGKRRTRA